MERGKGFLFIHQKDYPGYCYVLTVQEGSFDDGISENYHLYSLVLCVCVCVCVCLGECMGVCLWMCASVSACIHIQPPAYVHTGAVVEAG